MADSPSTPNYRKGLLAVSAVAIVLSFNQGPVKLSWSGIQIEGWVVWLGLFIAEAYFLAMYYASPYRSLDRDHWVDHDDNFPIDSKTGKEFVSGARTRWRRRLQTYGEETLPLHAGLIAMLAIIWRLIKHF